MTLEQRLQRAWELARHAREDLIKAEERTAQARRAYVQAADEALAIALVIAKGQEFCAVPPLPEDHTALTPEQIKSYVRGRWEPST